MAYWMDDGGTGSSLLILACTAAATVAAMDEAAAAMDEYLFLSSRARYLDSLRCQSTASQLVCVLRLSTCCMYIGVLSFFF